MTAASNSSRYKVMTTNKTYNDAGKDNFAIKPETLSQVPTMEAALMDEGDMPPLPRGEDGQVMSPPQNCKIERRHIRQISMMAHRTVTGEGINLEAGQLLPKVKGLSELDVNLLLFSVLRLLNEQSVLYRHAEDNSGTNIILDQHENKHATVHIDLSALTREVFGDNAKSEVKQKVADFLNAMSIYRIPYKLMGDKTVLMALWYVYKETVAASGTRHFEIIMHEEMHGTDIARNFASYPRDTVQKIRAAAKNRKIRLDEHFMGLFFFLSEGDKRNSKYISLANILQKTRLTEDHRHNPTRTKDRIEKFFVIMKDIGLLSAIPLPRIEVGKQNKIVGYNVTFDKKFGDRTTCIEQSKSK